MKYLRAHWFDIGLFFALVVGVYLILTPMELLPCLLWINLIALFLHQFEEYRYPGYFPGMMNQVMFNSKQPDRYPLNANSALIINVSVGWVTYFFAALLGYKAVWLGIAVMLVSTGNFIAHTFLFNIKGKRFYNPGMISSDLLFLPIAVVFFVLLIRGNTATLIDWIAGFVLGLVLNYVGILKMIDWFKDLNTRHIFPGRFLPPEKRKGKKDS